MDIMVAVTSRITKASNVCGRETFQWKSSKDSNTLSVTQSKALQDFLDFLYVNPQNCSKSCISLVWKIVLNGKLRIKIYFELLLIVKLKNTKLFLIIWDLSTPKREKTT